MNFKYNIAATSTPTAPCSNVLIECLLCGPREQAIWRYGFLHHLRVSHPTAPVDKYADLWTISPAETQLMKEIYRNRKAGMPVLKKRQPKVPLVISEAHSSRLSMRYVVDSFRRIF
ncbi:hypothetical protein B0H14DRAFT_2350730 [Mycena olivaceomarginata]|nr:hypothetical protein B0H14DRAFT_2406756 [Mycena olivaceomarginata]KAJ7860244.1 hypothetical protein B0H14DRAFT_2350730 [Mycena olivaceomarginata]